MDKRTNKQTNESPPELYRTLSPSGPLPKKRDREERETQTDRETDKQTNRQTNCHRARNVRDDEKFNDLQKFRKGSRRQKEEVEKKKEEMEFFI